MKFDNNYFSERIQCTDAEKMECLDTVKEMVRAVETVYKKGVLELENYHSDNAFLRECMEYLISGCWGTELSDIYETLLLAGNYQGKEFLKNMIIAQSLISISEQNESYPLSRVIPPLFGVGWYNIITEIIYNERKRFREVYHDDTRNN